MSILIDDLLDIIRNEFNRSPISWKNATVSKDEMAFLKKECNTESEFDPLNKRTHLLNKLAKNEAIITAKSCKYGKIIAIYENTNQNADVPWNLWGRILRIFSTNSGGSDDIPFKIFFLANTNLREFPSQKQIKPHNINGGYTYRCNRETILIYRAEDATRVLIHELNHSCCLDAPNMTVDDVEAETEAWAELIYIALLSEGYPQQFTDLLRKQSEWMQKQNAKVEKYIKSPKDFPWRYTIGKEDVWRRWGILTNHENDATKGHLNPGRSLRLTYPPDAYLKRKFDVNPTSTIL